MRPVPATRFCLLLFVLISAGCARPFVPAEKPDIQPADIEKLKERSTFWRDYQAKFRLRVESKTSKFSSRAIILVDGRNFVRFETFTSLGQTAALYVSNETGPALLIPSEKVSFTAQRPETLINEFLGVSLPADIFRYALTASVPPELLDNIESRFESGAWHLISHSGNSYFEWQIAAGSQFVRGFTVRSAEFDGRVSYDPPVSISKEAVPGKIRISSSEWNMEIDLQELKPTHEFKPSAFYMPEMSNIKKVDLDKIK